MILSEFLKGREVKINAVSNYISRNPEKFEGHVTREGKNTILDEEAVRILDEKYPMPKPVVIVNGVPEEEHRAVLERLNKAQEVIIMLQNELTDQKLLVAEREAHNMLLEDKQEHMEERLIEEKMKREAAESRISTLQEELEMEKNKTWLQKLFKK